jgi:hypothetical protein
MAEHSRLPSLAVSPLSDGHDDDRRVRVRRFAGIDRGTVTPSLLVLALAVLMSVVLPSGNRETPYRHPVHKGDIAELAGGISLVPTAEWDLASGTLAGHTRSVVGNTASARSARPRRSRDSRSRSASRRPSWGRRGRRATVPRANRRSPAGGTEPPESVRPVGRVKARWQRSTSWS